MKTIRTACCLMCLTAGCVSDELRLGEVALKDVPVLRPHHQAEYARDVCTDPARWSAEKPGLHAAFGSTDQRYPRCEAPAIGQDASTWQASGWRGERVNAQIVVWSSDPQEQVRVHVGDLKTDDGRVIDRARITVQMVRYVISDFPSGARGFSCDVSHQAAYLMADRLESFERFDLSARTVRPVWVSIDIPAAADPGGYRGAIQVQSLKDRVSLRLELQVQQLRLPPPREWKFRLDLWQNPWVVASYFQVEPWSEEHKTLLRKHLRLYADAGGKYVTTYAVHSPWSDNSFALEGAMIDWIKTEGGAWRFRYAIFDQYVELARECGVDRAITIYTPIPWSHRFRYLDEGTGNYVTEQWPPKSSQFKAAWKAFLEDLKEHLLAKGWFGKTFLGINENPLEDTLAAVQVIKEHSREWRITYAGDWHAELSPLLDDYSVIITREPAREELRDRAGRGFTTTYYVCCNPPQPNNFVFSAPVESRYLGWYAAAFGYDGFLRWAYDAWPADPTRDARHTLWPAGDCFLVYPGACSSVRFEKLREGIADFEKIRMLKGLAAGTPDPNVQLLMRRLEAHLAFLAAERDPAKRVYEPKAMEAGLEVGLRLMDGLSRELGK